MICPYCSHDNPAEAAACESCGATLHNKPKAKLALVNMLDANDKIKLHSGVLGREGDLCSERLAQDQTVSRFHLQVEEDTNGQVQIKHIGKNNPSLNGIQIDYGETADLKANGVLEIGNQLYKAIPLKVTYIIRCPVCGKVYKVSSSKDRIPVCTSCDFANRYEIAKESAQEEVFEDAD